MKADYVLFTNNYKSVICFSWIKTGHFNIIIIFIRCELKTHPAMFFIIIIIIICFHMLCFLHHVINKTELS